MGYGNVDRLSMQLVIVIDIVGFAPRSGAIFLLLQMERSHNFAILALWVASNYPFQTFEQYVLYVLDFRV